METTPVPPGFVPPPPLTPPPVIAPPSAPRPRKSYGWMLAAIILLVLLAVSLFGNLTQLITSTLSFHHGGFSSEAFGSAREIGPKLDECLLENNKSQNKIAVITVDGIITSHEFDGSGNNMVDIIAAQLDRARLDKHVKAVILKVDSPGGEVLASDEIYKEICAFQVETKKPVVCSMGSLAASGGYYISSGCRWIVANDLTITGSIGVIMHGWNYRGLMDKVGIAPMTFKSGKFKDMLSGERETNEIPEEEHAMVQSLIDQTYEQFKDVVADGRDAAHKLNVKNAGTKPDDKGQALADDWEDFSDGRVLSGSQALELGFVDELGDFDDTVDRTEILAGIKNSNLIEYREHYDLSSFLSMFGESGQSHDIKLQLGADIPKLRAGYMYFLYQP
jgi:protease-4